jgi:membrane-associated phospholipid phosphatase
MLPGVFVARRRTEPPVDAPAAGLRPAYLVVPLIAAAMLAFTLLAGDRYGLGLRDPDKLHGGRLLMLLGALIVFWALDVVPRAVMQSRAGKGGVLERVRAVARERWTVRRIGLAVGSITAFYITYLCYRNIKSYLPLARPELFDTELLEFERTLFGQDPSVYLHELLGTGVVAHVLSTVYLLYLTFVPISIGFALVWSTDTAKGMWWLSALTLNWILGALSYFLIPSMGPAFAAPELFTSLPDTGASALQQELLQHREAFLANPVGSGELQSIAAFASLHVAMVFTGVLMAHLLRVPRAVRIGLWAFLVLTVLSTIYFGWHYVVDDVAGLAIAIIAVYLGAWLTGWRIERRDSPRAFPVSDAGLG